MRDRATVRRHKRGLEKEKRKKSAPHFQETEARSQASFAFLYAFTLSVAGWEGDPLGGPRAPANSAAASPLLGFNIYLWG